jgi:uncharacterized membrane protein
MQRSSYMNSKARIAGHPIHPMVVVFPIAFYVATVATLLGYLGTNDAFYYRAAMTTCIGGVVMALVAAIPGAIDLFALPRGSRARTMGIRHASFALLTTGIFAVCGAFLYRGWTGRLMVDGRWNLEATIPLAIGVVGLVTLTIVGVLGWSLIQTHHVGIDPAPTRADVPPREPDLEDTLEDLPPPPRRAPHRAPGHITLH